MRPWSIPITWDLQPPQPSMKSCGASSGMLDPAADRCAARWPAARAPCIWPRHGRKGLGYGHSRALVNACCHGGAPSARCPGNCGLCAAVPTVPARCRDRGRASSSAASRGRPHPPPPGSGSRTVEAQEGRRQGGAGHLGQQLQHDGLEHPRPRWARPTAGRPVMRDDVGAREAGVVRRALAQQRPEDAGAPAIRSATPNSTWIATSPGRGGLDSNLKMRRRSGARAPAVA